MVVCEDSDGAQETDVEDLLLSSACEKRRRAKQTNLFVHAFSLRQSVDPCLKLHSALGVATIPP